MIDPILSRDFTQILANELVEKILDKLKSKEIVAMSQTCRRLRGVATAHGRFWHTCEMEGGMESPTAIRIKHVRFLKRVLTLTALELPIGVVLRFWYDPESWDGGSDDNGDDNIEDFYDDIPSISANAGLKSWRKPIQLVLSAKVEPRVISFDLTIGNIYAGLVFNDMALPKMSSLRFSALR